VAVTDYDRLSLSDIGHRLSDTARELVEKQILLGKQEAREQLRQAIRAAIWLGVGVALVLFAVVCLLIALTAGTAHILALLTGPAARLDWQFWVAALIWLVIFAVVGAICLLVGKGRIPTQPLGLTRATLKENLEWAKQRLQQPER
jgi:hypothetical protein